MCKSEKTQKNLHTFKTEKKENINKQCYSVPDKDIFHGVL